MTLEEWLDRRDLAPPPALRRRLDDAAVDRLGTASLAVQDAALEAAIRLLGTLLRGENSSRADALELLAVDALMTYAFEAAANEPERLEALGAQAMERIAAAATEHDA